MRIYIGYDPRDHLAFKVAQHSILENTRAPVRIIPMKEWELRRLGAYYRTYRVDRNGQMMDDADGKPFSTQFSFTRFCVPSLEGYGEDWVLFMDPDMMIRGDIAEVFETAESGPHKSVWCVKHDQVPLEAMKMDGVIQTSYNKKNWSSFMMMKPNRCMGLTPYAVNNWNGSALHGFNWLKEEDEIGELPPEWNFLAGHDEGGPDPKNVHFTLGTPDMEGPYRPATEWDADWWDCLDRHKKGLCECP
jgi:lipopolysaccharide biosynthesis glycosyltransferase